VGRIIERVWACKPDIGHDDVSWASQQRYLTLIRAGARVLAGDRVPAVGRVAEWQVFAALHLDKLLQRLKPAGRIDEGVRPLGGIESRAA
jgi:hypothetical protein